jgi:hypothetical protein
MKEIFLHGWMLNMGGEHKAMFIGFLLISWCKGGDDYP